MIGEQVAGEADVHRLDEAEHGGRGDGGIDGVAALLQDVKPGLRGERLAGGRPSRAAPSLRRGFGAPAIGAIAAYGVARGKLARLNANRQWRGRLRKKMIGHKGYDKQCQPTDAMDFHRASLRFRCESIFNLRPLSTSAMVVTWPGHSVPILLAPYCSATGRCPPKTGHDFNALVGPHALEI